MAPTKIGLLDDLLGSDVILFETGQMRKCYLMDQ